MLCFLARSFAKIARSAGINDFDSISAGNSIIHHTINDIKIRLKLAITIYSLLVYIFEINE
jgi:hypothetical protein